MTLRTSIIALLLAAAATAHGQAPRVIAAQGRLTNAAGAPLANGTYTVGFTIYNLPAGTFSVTNESETFANNTIQLAHFPVVLGSETVSGSGGVTYQRGAAYTINNATGVITRTVGSAIPATGAVSVSYQYTAAAMWTGSEAVQTVNGLFTTALPSAADIANSNLFPNNLTFANQTYYLGIKVGVDPEMSPRIALTGVPYALALPGLRTEPNAGDIPNIIGGFSGNSVAAGKYAAFIGGGGQPADYQGAHANLVTDHFGAIAGGYQNTAAKIGFVGGGAQNAASGQGSVVAGGAANTASGAASFVGGGGGNVASGLLSTVSGGGDIDSSVLTSDRASDDYSTVSGGFSNVAGDLNSDTTTAPFATVGGGNGNTAGATAATVPGGYQNSAKGTDSFAAGTFAQALHNGSFVWADDASPTTAFFSTGVNQFLVRAAGGVGINVNNPPVPLAVAGSIAVDASGLNNGNTGTGFISNGISFGGLTGEGIGSNRVNHATGLNLDGLDFYTGGTGVPRMSITNGGAVGIGTRNPIAGFALDVSGNVRCVGLTQTSSRRFKTDIQPIHNALGKIDRLRGVSYKWTAAYGGKRDIGLVAEEVGKVVPEVVAFDTDGKTALGVDYGHLNALAIQGIREQQAEIAALKSQNAVLARHNAAQQKTLSALAARLGRLEQKR